MMKAVNAIPGMGNPMTEEDEKGEPNAISAGYYFDVQPNAKQRSTEKRNGLFVNEELQGVFK